MHPALEIFFTGPFGVLLLVLELGRDSCFLLSRSDVGPRRLTDPLVNPPPFVRANGECARVQLHGERLACLFVFLGRGGLNLYFFLVKFCSAASLTQRRVPMSLVLSLSIGRNRELL